MAPPYLVSDAETGLAVMVDAPRARSAVNAVVASRFTACELDWKEVRALTIKGTKLIDAATGETDDRETVEDQEPVATDLPRFLQKDSDDAQASDAGAAGSGEAGALPADASPTTMFERLSDESRARGESANG